MGGRNAPDDDSIVLDVHERRFYNTFRTPVLFVILPLPSDISRRNMGLDGSAEQESPLPNMLVNVNVSISWTLRGDDEPAMPGVVVGIARTELPCINITCLFIWGE